MRAFGRHVVMNSVTGVILSNHGFAVSFNNVSACRYSRGVVSRQFSRSPRESNQISPPKYYSTHRLRSFFEREYKLEREDTIFVWRDEISISKRRGAEYLPPSLLHPQTWFTTFVFQSRRGSSSTALVPVRFIPATIEIYRAWFLHREANDPRDKKRMRAPWRRRGKFLFFRRSLETNCYVRRSDGKYRM